MLEITREYVHEVAEFEGFPRVTIHTQMAKSGVDAEKNRVRLQNSVTTALRELESSDVSAKDADALLQPVKDLADDWERMQHQIGSMSIFAGPEEARILELPVPVRETVQVGNYYNVRPILKPVLENREYAILTLSLGGVGLYRASRFGAELVELNDLPEDLCYVLRFDDFEKSVQHHTTGQHGHGAGKDEHDSFLSRFVDAVEPVVTTYLSTENLPVALIGTDEVLGYYRKRTRYTDVLEEQQAINPQTLSIDDVIRLGWECLAPTIESERREHIDRYFAHDNTVSGIGAVLPAAAEGRIDTLYIDEETSLRGTFDPQRETVTIADEPAVENEDLCNLAAAHSLRHGTEVVFVEEESKMQIPAAILR